MSPMSPSWTNGFVPSLLAYQPALMVYHAEYFFRLFGYVNVKIVGEIVGDVG
jgi:hypothetical protein